MSTPAPGPSQPNAIIRRLLEQFTPTGVIATISAALLAYTTHVANTIQNDVAQQNQQLTVIEGHQKTELAARKDAREALKEQSELTKTIFDEFVKAITAIEGTPEQRLDRLTGVLVLTYVIPDPQQKEGMGRAVQQAIDRIPKPDTLAGETRLAAAKFDVEQLVVQAAGERKQEMPVVAPTPAAAANGGPQWSNYDFDVFYCEASADASRPLAEKALAFRGKDPKASGRWRLRPLPYEVNSRPGYGVRGYEIRFSSADEKPLAEQLKELLMKELGAPAVTLTSSGQHTPYYLSVFVCPANG